MTDASKQKLQEIFKQCDTSGDGKLSIQEVAKVMRARGCKMSDQDIAKIFLQDDTSGDHKLSFEEFWASHTKRDPKTVREEELRAVFNEFDKDNSGFITQSDMKQVLGGRGVTDDAIQEMIDQVDKNDDDKVNFEEFLVMWNEKLN